MCCSPHPFNADETISTLRFAQRAKLIKNTVRVNRHRSAAELERIVARLEAELASARLGAPVSDESKRLADLEFDQPELGGSLRHSGHCGRGGGSKHNQTSTAVVVDTNDLATQLSVGRTYATQLGLGVLHQLGRLVDDEGALPHGLHVVVGFQSKCVRPPGATGAAGPPPRPQAARNYKTARPWRLSTS